MYDHNAVKIYTDGSARPNPGKGGIGMVVEYPDDLELDNFELSVGYVKSNNNRMELTAVIRALQWVQSEMSKIKITRVIIITDSEYVQSNHKNIQYWKSNKWLNEDGRPYENIDLWDIFLREMQKTKVPVTISWAKGKQSDILLRVDELAKQGTSNTTETDYGMKPVKISAHRTESKKSAVRFPANGDTCLIRVYMKSEYGKNDKRTFKISFVVYDEVIKKYSGKFVAYQKGECTLQRNNCYKVTFNESKTYPIILTAESVEYLNESD